MCYELEIVPRDVMFFRDARPIGGSAEGSGASWPLPSTFYSSMLSAISDRFDGVDWESKHTKLTDREKKYNKMDSTRFNFGGLKTWGPFPKDAEGHIYVPTPADLLPGDEDNSSAGVMNPVNMSGGVSNLPTPLKYPVASSLKPTKKKLGEWIPLDQLQKYLDGEVADLQTVPSDKLFKAEARPGIGMNPESRTTEDGKFYSAEYLRLKEYVSMAAFVECEAKKYQQSQGNDVIEKFFAASFHDSMIFGGQRGVAWLESKRKPSNASPLKMSAASIKSKLVKWVLLTPAYFKAGWCPGWVDVDGKVKLKTPVERGNITREEWREKIKTAPDISAMLMAARIPKPMVYSGWKLDNNCDAAGGAPKPTVMLVPAGSVYYFECDSQADAVKLVESLHGNTKSDEWGNKGFGLGVCSTWNLNNIQKFQFSNKYKTKKSTGEFYNENSENHAPFRPHFRTCRSRQFSRRRRLTSYA
eukprot:TRINITY_DN9275_c0_g1_i1.p1 TRINITY_DN9275_c0_g1~~TRINITY_DN9275_c0_g1_i1.p1  ORF type:complete len:471 (+),score=68.81 TRINITY_DN9275_c0_g1_i1:558-1970(+)